MGGRFRGGRFSKYLYIVPKKGGRSRYKGYLLYGVAGDRNGGFSGTRLGIDMRQTDVSIIVDLILFDHIMLIYVVFF